MSVWMHPASSSASVSVNPNRAPLLHDLPSSLPDADSPAPNALGFAIFLLLNAVFFIRPSEIFPSLAELPLYNLVIIPCIVVSAPILLFKVLTPPFLAQNPITICVLGLWPVAAVSMLGRITLADTQDFLTEYLKVIIYFLLLISCVNTPGRIRMLLSGLVVFITILTVVAIVQFSEGDPNYIFKQWSPSPDDPSVSISTDRLRSTGNFNDPNDLCMALGLGIVLCLCKFGDRNRGLLRILWLPPIALFGYALYLTQSRGGLLGILLGIITLFAHRFGWKKGLLLAALCSPGLFLISGTRQGDLDVGGDTAQSRIQLWSEGFTLLQATPLRGIGMGQYEEQVNHVAHNSFIHAFVELGFLGGALFTGAFFLAAWTITRLSKARQLIPDPEMARIQPYMLAAMASYMGSMSSLSRCYSVPTYLMLGLATVYVRTAVPSGVGLVRWDWALVKRLLLVGFLALVGLYLFTRTFVSFG